MHLGYLYPRYGKFAIGFHRESVVRHGFNPVLYGLDDGSAMQQIYSGFARLGNIDAGVLRTIADGWQEGVDDLGRSNNLVIDDNADWSQLLHQEADRLDRSVTRVREALAPLLGLVKTFSTGEFGTIYCEREWRSLTAFAFTESDIAMVILPRRVSRTEYFKPFTIHSSRLPREVPIVPWEDLIEH